MPPIRLAKEIIASFKVDSQKIEETPLHGTREEWQEACVILFYALIENLPPLPFSISEKTLSTPPNPQHLSALIAPLDNFLARYLFTLDSRRRLEMEESCPLNEQSGGSWEGRYVFSYEPNRSIFAECHTRPVGLFRNIVPRLEQSTSDAVALFQLAYIATLIGVHDVAQRILDYLYEHAYGTLPQ